MRTDNIVLIGLMGTGKTAVGYRIAILQRKQFIDTDTWIEEYEGKTIPDIFSEYGEAYFRELETKCLQSLLQMSESLVVSTGGGMPMAERNRPLLKSLGTVVYIKSTPDDICERIQGDENRPLLKQTNPYFKIKSLLAEREPVYKEVSDMTVVNQEKYLQQVVEEICGRIKDREARV